MADAPDTDLATAQAVIATLRAALALVQRENASLRRELDVLCQRLYGKKSERVARRQLDLPAVLPQVRMLPVRNRVVRGVPEVSVGAP